MKNKLKVGQKLSLIRVGGGVPNYRRYTVTVSKVTKKYFELEEMCLFNCYTGERTKMKYDIKTFESIDGSDYAYKCLMPYPDEQLVDTLTNEIKSYFNNSINPKLSLGQLCEIDNILKRKVI